jgi:hypothetical protein
VVAECRQDRFRLPPAGSACFHTGQLPCLAQVGSGAGRRHDRL